MKSLFGITVICLLFFTGCDINVTESVVNKTGKEKVLKCFAVYEDSTNIPLKDVLVSFSASYYPNRLTYATDSAGRCCIELLEASNIYELQIEKNGYVSVCFPVPESIFYLKPAAYIKFYIKNANVRNTDDYLSVNYSAVKCYEYGGIELSGANVERTIIVQTQPIHQTVSWYVWSNGMSSTYSKEIHIKSRDTTYIEIIY